MEAWDGGLDDDACVVFVGSSGVVDDLGSRFSRVGERDELVI